MPNDERNLETIPDGLLGLIPLDSCRELGLKVDRYLVGWRERRQHLHQHDAAFKGYRRDSYIISTSVPRFGTGEAKGRFFVRVSAEKEYEALHIFERASVIEADVPGEFAFITESMTEKEFNQKAEETGIISRIRIKE